MKPQVKKTDASLVSMTGYGSASGRAGDSEVNVEIKSVNGRFLDVRVKGSRQSPQLDGKIREIAGQHAKRGVIDISLNIKTKETSRSLKINLPLLLSYQKQLQEVAKAAQVRHEPKLMELLSLPGIVDSESDSAEDNTKTNAQILQTITLALEELAKSKVSEGAKLAQVLLREMNDIAKSRLKISKLKDGINKIYFDRIKGKVQALLDQFNTKIEDARVWQEVSFYAERSDVVEELDRLESHLKQFEEIITAPEGASSLGKRLEFLIQEIGRETNTIGAKSDDIEITKEVLEMKLCVERIREQIQNIE